MRSAGTVAAVVILLSLAGSAAAQGLPSGGGFSGGSGFTPGATTGGGAARGTGGYASYGGSSMFGRGVGGSVAGLTTRGDTSAGQITGSERFLRDSRQPATFVGSDSSEATGFFSALGNAFRGTAVGGYTLPDANQGGAGSMTQPMPYRLGRAVAFPVPQPPAGAVAQSLTTAFAQVRSLAGFPEIAVTVEGRTATLRGSVTSPEQRALVERLARLEPGIDSVRNELAVTTPPLPAP